MAELYYGEDESFPLEAKPVTVGTQKGCTLKLDTGLDQLTEAVAIASVAAAAAVAANDLSEKESGILVEEGKAEVDPPMRFFVVQPHAPGHFLKNLAGESVVRVNGKSAVLHRLVDGDKITAKDHEFEYVNPDMPPGTWEHLEKKRGVRSIRWLLPAAGVLALLVFGFWQWVVYAGKKHESMERANSQVQSAPISNEEAQAILTDISRTSEERLAKMAPEDLRRVREDFMLSEDATEEEKAANLEALGKMFGVDTVDLLEGGNAADILAMVGNSEGGRLQYKDKHICDMSNRDRMIAMERLAAMERFIEGQRKFVAMVRQEELEALVGRILDGEEAPFRKGSYRFKLKLEGLDAEDRKLVDRTGGALAGLGVGGDSIKDLPPKELATLRIRESDAVMSYLQHGHRGESWDAAAVTAIQIDARLRILKSMNGRRAARDILVTMSTATLGAGCQDPLILLIRERLARERGIEIPFEGSGSTLENAVFMIKRLDDYPQSPIQRSRIYRHGVEVTLDFAMQEGEPTLKGMPLNVFVEMPIEVAKDWNRWIDLGVADVVAGAPKLTSAHARMAYTAVVRETFLTFSRARGERESVKEALGEIGNLDGGDKVLASLETHGKRKR